MAKRFWQVVSVTAAVTLVLSGCADSGTQVVTTPPVEDPVIETPPLTDDDLEEEVVVEDLVFDSLDECLQGNWAVDNESFGEYFRQTDERVVDIDVTGLATLTVEDDTYRMFFTDWEIRFDTGEPTFLISRNGNEAVQFVINDDSVLEVVERDDQVTLDEFSIVGSGDTEAIGIASSRPGPLPLEGATFQCTGTTLEVFVELDSFLLNRR